jgi:hypothetical protein
MLIPAAGVRQMFTATFTHRIADGGMAETWRNADDLDRMLQLGVRLLPSGLIDGEVVVPTNLALIGRIPPYVLRSSDIGLAAGAGGDVHRRAAGRDESRRLGHPAYLAARHTSV